MRVCKRCGSPNLTSGFRCMKCGEDNMPTADAVRWPLGLEHIEDLPWPVKLVSRSELAEQYPRAPKAKDTQA